MIAFIIVLYATVSLLVPMSAVMTNSHFWQVLICDTGDLFPCVLDYLAWNVPLGAVFIVQHSVLKKPLQRFCGRHGRRVYSFTSALCLHCFMVFYKAVKTSSNCQVHQASPTDLLIQYSAPTEPRAKKVMHGACFGCMQGSHRFLLHVLACSCSVERVDATAVPLGLAVPDLT